MKRGCLIRTFLYLIIAAAVVLYLVEKYGKPIYEESKENIKQSILTKLDNQLNDFTGSSVQDSLTGIVKEKVNQLKSESQIDSIKFDQVISDLKSFLAESKIDSQLSFHLKEIISEYEQRKK